MSIATIVVSCVAGYIGYLLGFHIVNWLKGVLKNDRH